MSKIWAIIFASIMLLSGCSADTKSLASEACESLILRPDSYNDSLDGDKNRLGGEIASVNKQTITQKAKQHDDGGNAFYIKGTSQVTSDEGISAQISWVCFAQTSDSKTYASIIEWKVA